jgi:hypothetical protein
MTGYRPISVGTDKPPLVQLFVWEHLQARESGDLLDTSVFSKVAVQIEGVSSAVKVGIEGSIDGEHWYVLIDSQDNHMQYSFPGLADVGQVSRYIRPTVVGGDEMTDVTVYALCRGIR